MSESTTTCGERADDYDEVPPDEGRRLLDEAARKSLNMTGDEFLAAWDEGRIPAPDSLRVQQVAALIPFAR